MSIWWGWSHWWVTFHGVWIAVEAVVVAVVVAADAVAVADVVAAAVVVAVAVQAATVVALLLLLLMLLRWTKVIQAVETVAAVASAVHQRARLVAGLEAQGGEVVHCIGCRRGVHQKPYFKDKKGYENLKKCYMKFLN